VPVEERPLHGRDLATEREARRERQGGRGLFGGSAAEESSREDGGVASAVVMRVARANGGPRQAHVASRCDRHESAMARRLSVFGRQAPWAAPSSGTPE
jgi:hypothetical protein